MRTSDTQSVDNNEAALETRVNAMLYCARENLFDLKYQTASIKSVYLENQNLYKRSSMPFPLLRSAHLRTTVSGLRRYLKTTASLGVGPLLLSYLCIQYTLAFVFHVVGVFVDLKFLDTVLKYLI